LKKWNAWFYFIFALILFCINGQKTQSQGSQIGTPMHVGSSTPWGNSPCLERLKSLGSHSQVSQEKNEKKNK
jgi:hypothetical protein